MDFLPCRRHLDDNVHIVFEGAFIDGLSWEVLWSHYFVNLRHGISNDFALVFDGYHPNRDKCKRLPSLSLSTWGGFGNCMAVIGRVEQSA